MKYAPIPGCTTSTDPSDDQIALAIVGKEGTGKSRFAITAPFACQGWLILDRKTLTTIDPLAKENGVTVFRNEKEFLSHREASILLLESDNAKIKTEYFKIMAKVNKNAAAYLAHPNIDLNVIDGGTALCEYITSCYFESKQGSQEGGQRSWGKPKQDFKDLIDGLKTKPLIATFQTKPIFVDNKDTGLTKADALSNAGHLFNVVIRLRDKWQDAGKKPTLTTQQKKNGETIDPLSRFTLDIMQCQFNKDLEGEQDVLTGEDINWNNLMAMIGKL